MATKLAKAQRALARATALHSKARQRQSKLRERLINIQKMYDQGAIKLDELAARMTTTAAEVKRLETKLWGAPMKKADGEEYPRLSETFSVLGPYISDTYEPEPDWTNTPTIDPAVGDEWYGPNTQVTVWVNRYESVTLLIPNAGHKCLGYEADFVEDQTCAVLGTWRCVGRGPMQRAAEVASGEALGTSKASTSRHAEFGVRMQPNSAAVLASHGEVTTMPRTKASLLARMERERETPAVLARMKLRDEYFEIRGKWELMNEECNKAMSAANIASADAAEVGACAAMQQRDDDPETLEHMAQTQAILAADAKSLREQVNELQAKRDALGRQLSGVLSEWKAMN